MNYDDYIDIIDGRKYVNDTIYNNTLLVKHIKSVSSLPSGGEDRTLYILGGNVFYYKNGYSIKQILPMKIEKKINEIKEEETILKKYEKSANFN